MADKKIMLACAAGMSTSLLVTKMQEAAKAAGGAQPDAHRQARREHRRIAGRL